MERVHNLITILLIAVATISYTAVFLILSAITIYLSAGFSILIIYIQTECDVLNKIVDKIIDLIIKVYGE